MTTEISAWAEYEMYDKVADILIEVVDYNPDHHFGRPFLTAYQIAIEFARRHPAIVAELGVPIGGEGTGLRNSLAQYLAAQLSRTVKGNPDGPIEGAFLSNEHLDDITFEAADGPIRSSLTNTSFPLSMFRWRGK